MWWSGVCTYYCHFLFACYWYHIRSASVKCWFLFVKIVTFVIHVCMSTWWHPLDSYISTWLLQGFVMNMQPSEAEVGFDVRLPPTTDLSVLKRRIDEEWAPNIKNMTYQVRMSLIYSNGFFFIWICSLIELLYIVRFLQLESWCGFNQFSMVSMVCTSLILSLEQVVPNVFGLHSIKKYDIYITIFTNSICDINFVPLPNVVEYCYWLWLAPFFFLSVIVIL